jgi:hypothetical protein
MSTIFRTNILLPLQLFIQSQNFGGGNQLQPSSSFIPSDFSSSENFGGGIQCQFSFSSTSKYYSSGNLGGGTGGGLFTRLSSTGLGIYSPSCSYSSLNPPPPPLSPSISAAFDNCILSYLTTRFKSHVSWAASLEPKVRDVFWDIYSRFPPIQPIFEALDPSLQDVLISNVYSHLSDPSIDPDSPQPVDNIFTPNFSPSTSLPDFSSISPSTSIITTDDSYDTPTISTQFDIDSTIFLPNNVIDANNIPSSISPSSDVLPDAVVANDFYGSDSSSEAVVSNDSVAVTNIPTLSPNFDIFMVLIPALRPWYPMTQLL